MKNVLKLINTIFKHPLNKDNIYRAFFRFVIFNLKTRFTFKRQIVFNWVNDSKFLYLISKKERLRQRQLKFNCYLGLAEYVDMSFLLHCLKKEDLFIDCGSNLGLYSILASKVIGANSITFEPHPDTIEKLISQLEINNINNKVEIIKKAVGEKVCKVFFSNKFDLLKNQVIVDKDQFPNKDFIQVEMTTLDTELKNITQNFILKIDIEGFEYLALKGAKSLLKSDKLKALIIENNSKMENYNRKSNDVNIFLSEYNLFPINYLPKQKIIDLDVKKLDDNLNMIYIKDPKKINLICNRSGNFKIHTAGSIEI